MNSLGLNLKYMSAVKTVKTKFLIEPMDKEIFSTIRDSFIVTLTGAPYSERYKINRLST